MKGIAEARRCLKAEADAVSRLAENLGPDFAQVITLIEACRGRVVLLGLGKSGHIGAKIAATLASTGTRAFFVHADEALHGDLGMIGPEDVVLVLSHSGETAEMVSAVRQLMAVTRPQLVAITSRPESTLARMADAVLDYGVKAESDTLGVAPTTSTTATLALGDALAVALMARRDFTRDDFHKYHPGGALGKALSEARAAAGEAAAATESGAAAVVVVGSFMMDVITQVDRRPLPGETLIGNQVGLFPGGKGFNQVVEVARAGCSTAMVGRIGMDTFGDMFLETLKQERIDGRYVVRDTEVGTGVAMPVVDASGQNSIIIVPQANLRVTPADVEAARPLLESARVLVLQGEIAVGASTRAAQIAHAAGCRVLLNPAPAGELPPELLAASDLIMPNEVEAAMLTGVSTDSIEGAAEAARCLLKLGPSDVVITLGGRGCLWVNAEAVHHVPAFAVKPVDTTGAGDAFVGALAAALARGMAMPEALVRANAAGALAATRFGAMPSMPLESAVDQFVAEHQDPNR